MSKVKFISIDCFFNNQSEVGLMILELTKELGKFWTEDEKELTFQTDWNDVNDSEFDHRVNVFVKFQSDEDVQMFKKLYKSVRSVTDRFESDDFGPYVQMVTDEEWDSDFEDEVMKG